MHNRCAARARHRLIAGELDAFHLLTMLTQVLSDEPVEASAVVYDLSDPATSTGSCANPVAEGLSASREALQPRPDSEANVNFTEAPDAAPLPADPDAAPLPTDPDAAPLPADPDAAPLPQAVSFGARDCGDGEEIARPGAASSASGSATSALLPLNEDGSFVRRGPDGVW